jgi:hypothetical protein
MCVNRAVAAGWIGFCACRIPQGDASRSILNASWFTSPAIDQSRGVVGLRERSLAGGFDKLTGAASGWDGAAAGLSLALRAGMRRRPVSGSRFWFHRCCDPTNWAALEPLSAPGCCPAHATRATRSVVTDYRVNDYGMVAEVEMRRGCDAAGGQCDTERWRPVLKKSGSRAPALHSGPLRVFGTSACGFESAARCDFLEEPLVLFGQQVTVPALCLGFGQGAMPGIELRVVPQALDRRDPRGDFVRGRDDKIAGRAAVGDCEHKSRVAQSLGERAPVPRRYRAPGPGASIPTTRDGRHR